MIYTSG